MEKRLLLTWTASLIFADAFAQYLPVFKESTYENNNKEGNFANFRGFKETLNQLEFKSFKISL